MTLAAKGTLRRKRPLRRQPEIEHLLWLRLRALNALGWNFHKASPFRNFLLPFVEHKALLVVELGDRGSIVRDRLLREAGYVILRFSHAGAAKNLNAVMAKIHTVLEDFA